MQLYKGLLSRITFGTAGIVCILSVLAACTVGPSQWRHVGGNSWIQQEGGWAPDTSGEQSMLVSERRFEDFYLSVEFKPDDTVNSGVFFRCQDPVDITPFSCFEANIWDNHPVQKYRTGAVVEVFSPPLAQVSTIGQWNTYEISAVGRNITVKVNGTLTASFDSTLHSGGHIALQWGGTGNVEFRKLEITEL